MESIRNCHNQWSQFGTIMLMLVQKVDFLFNIYFTVEIFIMALLGSHLLILLIYFFAWAIHKCNDSILIIWFFYFRYDLLHLTLNMHFCCSWCHCIFPIQATCSLNEKELQTVVSKLVFWFMNDKQPKVSHPLKVKFKPIIEHIMQ